MTKQEKPSSKMLITLVEENRVGEVKDLDRLKQILNVEPPAKWVRENPYARGVKYLPIDKVELMLDTIFQEWRSEIKSVSQLAQSVVCVVRVHYRNPVTGEWSFCDGVGATPLKTDKGYDAADMAHIKSDAVSTGAPAAESYAIKDAAEHLGKIFGRDLNRSDTVSFSGAYVNGEREEVEDIKPETPKKPSHTVGVDFQYANLKLRLGQGDLITNLTEARDKMTEDEVKEKISEMEAALGERGKAQQEAREDAKSNFQMSMLEPQEDVSQLT